MFFSVCPIGTTRNTAIINHFPCRRSGYNVTSVPVLCCDAECLQNDRLPGWWRVMEKKIQSSRFIYLLFVFAELHTHTHTHTHAERERERERVRPCRTVTRSQDALKNTFYFRNCGSEFVTIQVKCKLTEMDLLPYFSTGRVHVNMALQTPDRIFKRKPSVHQNC